MNMGTNSGGIRPVEIMPHQVGKPHIRPVLPVVW
jgi:hypothetical protein